MALIFDSWLVELAAVFVALLTGIYFYVAHSFQHWEVRGVPYIKPSFPFGNFSDVFLQRRSLGESFKDMYWRLEGHPYGGVFQLLKPSLLLRDPEVIKTVLVKDFANFHDHGNRIDEKLDPLSGNLFSLEGTKWKHLRYKLLPTFTSGKMKAMYPTMLGCGDELKTFLAPIAARKETIEVKDILARYGTDIIATCAFGIESNCLKNPNSEFRKMGRKVFEPSLKSMLRDLIMVLAPWLTTLLKLPFVAKDISKFFISIVKETIEYREKFEVHRNDFMQLMINIKNKKSIEDPKEVDEQKSENVEEKVLEKNMYDVKGLTTNEIAAQAFVFFLAGFESSSTTMSFCLYELALNQDIQDRLREELDAAVEKHGGQLTYEVMQKMDYMDQVVAETLRKYPISPMLMRICTKDCQLPDGVKVESGTPVNIPVYGLQHDPQYYPDPERFDPERFTEEAKSNRHHYVYLPFGEGPRICIGSRFGLMQIKIGIASFISSYKIDVCKKLTAIPLVMDTKAFMLTPRDGMHLQITERDPRQ